MSQSWRKLVLCERYCETALLHFQTSGAMDKYAFAVQCEKVIIMNGKMCLQQPLCFHSQNFVRQFLDILREDLVIQNGQFLWMHMMYFPPIEVSLLLDLYPPSHPPLSLSHFLPLSLSSISHSHFLTLSVSPLLLDVGRKWNYCKVYTVLWGSGGDFRLCLFLGVWKEWNYCILRLVLFHWP